MLSIPWLYSRVQYLPEFDQSPIRDVDESQSSTPCTESSPFQASLWSASGYQPPTRPAPCCRVPSCTANQVCNSCDFSNLLLTNLSFSQPGRVHIMANPNRGGRGHPNGRGGPPHVSHAQPIVAPALQTENNEAAQQKAPPTAFTNGNHVPAPMLSRGLNPRGRGGFVPGFRGGRGSGSNGDRGRGAPRGGFRGRGRGSFATPLPS